MANAIISMKVARLIREGTLPRLSAESRVFGGRGEGCQCDICEQMITSGEVQYDVEFKDGETRKNLHLHLECHRAWIEAAYDREVWRESLIG